MLKLSLTVLPTAIKEIHSRERSLSPSISPPRRKAQWHGIGQQGHCKHQGGPGWLWGSISLPGRSPQPEPAPQPRSEVTCLEFTSPLLPSWSLHLG